MIEDLIKRNRSCRRFFQKEVIPLDTLEWLVNLARLSASAPTSNPSSIFSPTTPKRTR